VEPDSDGSRREATIALAVDYRQIGTRAFASLLMKCYQRGLESRVSGDDAASTFSL